MRNANDENFRHLNGLIYWSDRDDAVQTIGSHEAKARLPELLRSVEQGSTFAITRRGVPIARLVGITHLAPDDVAGVIARMKRARAERSSVTKEDIMSARDQGRLP